MKEFTNLMVLGWELISPKYHEDGTEWRQCPEVIKMVATGVTWLVSISWSVKREDIVKIK